jgi:hypothetical protein
MSQRIIYALSTMVLILVLATAIKSYFYFSNLSKRAKIELALQTLAPALANDEIDYGFHVVDGIVVFEGSNDPSAFIRKRVHTPVTGADAETFRAFKQVFPEGQLRCYYGVDKNAVFVTNSVGTYKLQADPLTFRLLDNAGRFACDKESVFFVSVKIPGADPQSFKRLSGDFSVDAHCAYLGHLKLEADPKTFEATSPGYIRVRWGGHGKFEEQPFTQGWNRDANNVYFGTKRFDKADPSTFQDLGFAHYAKDKYNVYIEDKIIKNADPNTFEIIGRKYLNYFESNLQHPIGHGPLARDKNHFYCYSWIIDREGPWIAEYDAALRETKK